MYFMRLLKLTLRDRQSPVSNFSDSQLLDAIQRNNQQAFEALFERYWEAMFNVVYTDVHSVEVSRAIVQDIFVCLWEKRAVLSKNHLRSYLLEDARNRSVNYLTSTIDQKAIGTQPETHGQSSLSSAKHCDDGPRVYLGQHLPLKWFYR